MINQSKKEKISALRGLLITNAAKRQTVPAFRQEGVWRIEKNYIASP